MAIELIRSETGEIQAACHGVFVEGKRGRIFTTVYHPTGMGPFPVVIVCHGMPGNERMLGFAEELREQGFCVVHFHYSGSWGSDGSYAFEHCTQDVDSVVRFVEENESGLFDTDKIFMLGHSLGGFVTCYAVGNHPNIKAAAVAMPGDVGAYFDFAEKAPENEAMLRAVMEDFGTWLVDYSYDTDKDNAKKYPGKYHLATYAEALSKIPVFFVAGTNDPSPTGIKSDIWPLLDVVKAYGTGKERVQEFDTDHGMNTNRQEIKAAVTAFFKEVCGMA